MASRALRQIIVNAEPYDCPYLPGRIARTPLRHPIEPVTPEQFDELLAAGDRRAGMLLYRTECPACRACEALRIPVRAFAPTRSQRRALRRNDDLRIEIGPPRVTEERVALYNRHRRERGLATGEDDVSLDAYRLHYAESCVETIEVAYFEGSRLIAASVLDLGRRSASSVYHFFDPGEAKRSPGVYSVLREVQLCAEWGLDWYYLGLWAEGCDALRYKSSYYPHERLLRGGVWRAYPAPNP